MKKTDPDRQEEKTDPELPVNVVDRNPTENKERDTVQEIRSQDWEKTFDAIDDWICIIDLDSSILRSNRSGEKQFNLSIRDIIGQKCCHLAHGTDKPVDNCPLPKMLKTCKRESAELQIKNGAWMLITVDPILDATGNLIRAVHIARDITNRKAIEKEREILLHDLQKALDQVKTLSGFLPICANCKKIRDDQGYWNQIEHYIEKHSDALFSHSICPECSDKLYGGNDWYQRLEKKENKKKDGR